MCQPESAYEPLTSRLLTSTMEEMGPLELAKTVLSQLEEDLTLSESEDGHK